MYSDYSGGAEADWTLSVGVRLTGCANVSASPSLPSPASWSKYQPTKLAKPPAQPKSRGEGSQDFPFIPPPPPCQKYSRLRLINGSKSCPPRSLWFEIHSSRSDPFTPMKTSRGRLNLRPLLLLMSRLRQFAANLCCPPTARCREGSEEEEEEVGEDPARMTSSRFPFPSLPPPSI